MVETGRFQATGSTGFKLYSPAAVPKEPPPITVTFFVAPSRSGYKLTR
jgi:hypothetical protein